MPYDPSDNIAAVASATGGAARGVVRLTGPTARECLRRCFDAEDFSWEAARRPAVFDGNLLIDSARRRLPVRVYFWPGERSYTRQPMVEIQSVGSPPILGLILKSLCAAGARQAAPGEFTLRAFLAGRIDLTQAEAVLGVIDAADRRQLDVALDQLAGGLAVGLNALRYSLLDLLAEIEAGLDFAEEPIEFVSSHETVRQLDVARGQLIHLNERLRSHHALADLPRIVLVGSANAGKSTLFNRLVNREAALVADVPGTTRDYVTAELTVDGMDCILIDTAGKEAEGWQLGLEAATSAIAGAAERLASEQYSQADVVLFCLDHSRPRSDWERAELANAAEEGARRILVLTKCDLPGANASDASAIQVSACTGEGLDQLQRELARMVAERRQTDGASVAATAVRCGESLKRAEECIDRALRLATERGGDELVAAEIRVALDALAEVVGATYTDDILDRIFSRFCIGK